MKLPKTPKQWRGCYAGRYFGDLYQTLNIDLERNPGRLSLSNKMRRLIAGLGVVHKFLRTDALATDQWFGLVQASTSSATDGDILRNGDTSIIGGTWISDATDGAGDASPVNVHDMILHGAANGEQRLLVSTATDIAVLNSTDQINLWDNDWFSSGKASGGAALSNTVFHPMARLGRMAAVGDVVTATTTKQAVIHTIDKDDVATLSRLIFPPGYTVRLANASADRFWFGLQSDVGGSAKIVEWDGGSQSYFFEYDLQGSYPLTCWLKNGIPFYVTELGYIFKYSGGGFTKVQEFPMAEDRQVFSATRTAENTINAYGSWIDGDVVYINVGAPVRTGTSDLTGGSHRMRSGIWIFNTTNNNLYHHMGLGEHITAGTDLNYACSPLTSVGAVIRQITSNKPQLIASASVPVGGTNWDTASTNAIFQEIESNVQTDNGGRNRGYFITPYLPSEEMETFFQGLWLKFRKFVNANNRFIIKTRVTEPLRDADASDESPLQAQATWTSTTTFTCVVPTGVAVGDEVEVMTGDNGGCCFDISILSATPDGSATITVTISEVAPMNSTDKFIARFDNWDSETAISDTTIGNILTLFTAAKDGEFVQIKVELRGFSNFLDEMLVTSIPKTEAKQA